MDKLRTKSPKRIESCDIEMGMGTLEWRYELWISTTYNQPSMGWYSGGGGKSVWCISKGEHICFGIKGG